MKQTKMAMWTSFVLWPGLVTVFLTALNTVPFAKIEYRPLDVFVYYASISFLTSAMVHVWRRVRNRGSDDDEMQVFRACAVWLTAVSLAIVLTNLIFFVAFREPFTWVEVLYDLGLGLLVVGGLVSFRAYRSSRDRYAALELSAVESRYSVLKNQMQPHFLFNALNGISELVRQDATQAVQTIQNLAGLYRQILENSLATTSSLVAEGRIVHDYLAIESLRFGGRLSYSIELPPAADRLFVPSLVLQTLVENAVKHGIAQHPGPGKIRLIVSRDETSGRWVVRVTNTGAPLIPKAPRGVGLENTVKRLDLLYGPTHGFAIRTNTDGETEVSFRFVGEAIA